MRTVWTLFAVLAIGAVAYAALEEHHQATPDYFYCLKYVDGNVSYVGDGGGLSNVTVGFANGSTMYLNGAYGFTIDRSRISRIAYRPSTRSYKIAQGRIESVRFIPADSVGMYPTESACRMDPSVEPSRAATDTTE
jgi:hypothetical protein